MLVICAGMQKSGSGYIYNIVNAMLFATGNADARHVKETYELDKTMRWHNNNIGRLSFFKLFRLWRVSKKTGTYAVKTHRGPTTAAIVFQVLGLTKILYSYRDPRDVILSAVDHGKRLLSEGRTDTFGQIASFSKAALAAKKWTKVWKRYHRLTNVLELRYEDAVDNPRGMFVEIEEFLGVQVPECVRDEILWRFSKGNRNAETKGLHFNKATIHRYAREMTEEQKKACERLFGQQLTAMGYERTPLYET